MTIEDRPTMLRWLSRFTVVAVGIASFGLTSACSPVFVESNETTDDTSGGDAPARSTGPSIAAPLHDGAPVQQSGVSEVEDCFATWACKSLMCTEPGRYEVQDDVVIDLRNGLRLWQRNFASDLDYEDALGYCSELKLNGLTGWRLPDGAETGSLVLNAGGLQGCGAPKFCAPAIDQQAFPDTAPDLYWIAQVYCPGMHRTLNFCDGRSTPYPDADESLHYVRCVHDPI